MTFEEQGYLSDDMPEIRRIVEGLFQAEFALSLEVSALAHLMLRDEFIDAGDLQQTLCACLLMRILEGHQAMHILCGNGITVSSNVLLRSNVEALIILKYISLDKRNLRQYVGTEQLQRRRMLNVILNDPSGAYSERLRKGITKEMLDEIDRSITELGASEINIEELSKRVGLHQIYQTAYRVLSYDVHILPKSLERYLVLNDEHDIVAMDFTPKNADIPVVLGQSTAALLNAIDCLSTLLDVHSKYESRVAALQARLDPEKGS